jgi:tetratricopeptide (TPR) repeat protein/transcriptional regulator with XRE-family HTH domain
MAMTMPSRTFGDLLRRYRLAASLTQEELAERAGLSLRGISDLERGVRRAPRRETIQLLAEALHLSAAERSLMEGTARQRGIPAKPAPRRDSGARVWASGFSSAPLVGRTYELALVDQLLADGPPVLLVTGEPGIGKSRLLQAGIERAERAGWTVVSGGGHRRSGQEPYAPLVGALADSLRYQSAAQQRLHVQGCARLVSLLPELAETGVVSRPTWTLPPEQERRLMFGAVARYLTNVSGPAGTLLVLDDLHWAGPDALDLVRAVVLDSPGERPLRLLAAYRDTDLAPQDPLALLAADLTREGQARRAFLAPLAEAEATALLEELLPEMDPANGDTRLRRQVLERTGGVPLYLVCCVQALATGHLSWNGANHVPWTLHEAILQRVVALPEAAQQLLRLAAVAGSRVLRALLMAVAPRIELAEEVVLEALEGCGRARLLIETDGDAYQFSHDLIREVLLTDLGTARRALLHRRVAETLEQMTGTPPIEALAYHYAQSGEGEKVISYLERAGDAAWARYAHAEAAEAYREVVTRLEAAGNEMEAARAREKLGQVLALLARYDEALEALAAAAARYDLAGEREGQVRALAQLGQVHRWRGTAQEGLGRLLPLVETLTMDAPSQATASFYVALTHLYFGTGHYQKQLTLAGAAATMAQTLGDDRLRAVAQGQRGSALVALGRLEEAYQILSQEVIPLAEAARDAQTWSHAHSHLVEIATYRGEFVQARDYVERALTNAEQPSDRGRLAYLTVQRGLLAFLLGEWERARGDFHLAAELAPPGAFTSYPLGALGLLNQARGDEETAAAYFTKALAQAEQHHDVRAQRWLQRILAERDLLAGRPEQAGARLAPLLDLANLAASDVEVKQLLPLVAWVYVESGELGRAEQLLTPLLAETRAAQLRLTLYDALPVRGLLAVRRGRWLEAEESFEEALGLAHDFPHPYGEAKVLMWYGDLLLQRHEPVRARQRFEAALAILNRLGERLYARRIEQLFGPTAGGAGGESHG